MRKTADVGRMTGGRGLWRWLCTHRQGGKLRGTFGIGAKVVGAFGYEYVSEGPFVNMHI